MIHTNTELVFPIHGTAFLWSHGFPVCRGFHHQAACVVAVVLSTINNTEGMTSDEPLHQKHDNSVKLACDYGRIVSPLHLTRAVFCYLSKVLDDLNSI